MSDIHDPNPRDARDARELRDPRERDDSSGRAPQGDVWGSIPKNERFAWSNALIDNPPSILNMLGRMANRTQRYSQGIVSLNSWIKTARHYNELGLTAADWLLLKDVLAPFDPDPWLDCSAEERCEWSAATLQFPPHFVGATISAMVTTHVQRTGINICEPWISLALEFRAADYTVDEFILLNELVRAFARDVPGVIDSPMVPATKDHDDYRVIQLRAADWLNWLLRYRGGADPAALFAAIVAPEYDFEKRGDPRLTRLPEFATKYTPES
jgi:hypothetical protein